jgi:signal peptidase I
LPDADPKPQQGEKKTKKKNKTLELFECLLVAVALALTIRHFAFQIFKIPTRSMEPALIGNEDYGDRVVAAMWYKRGGFLPLKLARPERWQVIVFNHYDNAGKPTNFIKRLIGLPGERVEIRDGDIWVGKAGNAEGARIAQKPPRVQEQLWTKLCDLSMAEPWRVPYYWEIAGSVKLEGGAAVMEGSPESSARLHWTPKRPIDNRFIRLTVREVVCRNVDCKARFKAAFDTARPVAFCPKCHTAVWGVHDRGAADGFPELLIRDDGSNAAVSNYWAEVGGGSPVPDLRLALDFANLGNAGQLAVTLTGRGERYLFTLDLQTGAARLTGPRPEIRDERTTSLASQPSHHLEVVNVDGVFRAELDGRALGSCTYVPRAELAGGASDAEVTVLGGARVAIRNIRLCRDIYYGEQGPKMSVCAPDPKSHYIDLPERGYFFMGDNSLASSDGRAFGPKDDKDLVARGAFVAWPPSRIHLVW